MSIASQLGALTYKCGNSAACQPGQYVTVGTLNYNNTGYSTAHPPEFLYRNLCGPGTDAAVLGSLHRRPANQRLQP